MKSSHSPHAAKHWCFTLNNPDVLPSAVTEALSPHTEYLIFQEEEGENHTRHFQGYFILTTKKRLTFLKKLLPRAHYESARGTLSQNRAYCSKEEGRLSGPYETGSVPSKSSSVHQLDFQRAVQSGMCSSSLWEHHFQLMLKHYRAVSAYRVDTQQVHRSRPSCFIFFGPAGIGKSRLARDVYPFAYFKDVASKWWDGYEGQPVVVFDDFYGGIQLSTLLRVLDFGPCLVEFKGGYIPLSAEVFVFTSNDHPRDWYAPRSSRAIEGLRRRFTEFSSIYTRESLQDSWRKVSYDLY